MPYSVMVCVRSKVLSSEVTRQGFLDEGQGVKSTLTSAIEGPFGTHGSSPSCRDILATMQPTTGEEYRRTSQRSWVALAAGIVLIAGAVFLSMRRLASDVLTTVAGVAGFLAICYGLVIQVMALLNNREPDE
jgi:hypothetical protein